MPRIAKNIDSFVEDLFVQFGLPIKSGIRAAAFIRAAGVEAEVN